MIDNKNKRTYANELTERNEGEEITIGGWLEDIRDIGSIIFGTIRDNTGLIQIIIKKENQDVFNRIKTIPRQSAMLVDGIINNSKAKDFKVEIKVSKIEIVSEAESKLPLDPTGRVNSSLDGRLDSRALDLRNPNITAIFKIRHQTIQSIRESFIEQGFLEVTTPKIIGQAAEGGSTLFELNYFNDKAYLAQSPQLYKEQLTLALDKVFEINAFYRAEKSHTTRHLNEFTSVDIEAAFYDEKEVMKVCEKMIKHTINEINKRSNEDLKKLEHVLPKINEPFKEITYEKAIEDLKGTDSETEMGEDLSDSALKKLGEIHKEFYFITRWPIKLKPFYIKADGEFSPSFDLMYGALELASGGTRISNREELEKRITESGLKKESFESHLRTYDWGMPPHSGWGFGLDRFLMVLTGKKNVREVVLYPREQSRLLP